MRRFRLLSAALLALLVIPAAGGCRFEPLAPAERNTLHSELARSGPQTIAPDPERASNAYFPLEIGNRWHYVREVTFETHPAQGPPTTEHFTAELEHLLVCVQPLGARSYVADRVTETTSQGSGTYGIYFRQDRAGLYEYDFTGAPSCNTPGAVSRVGGFSESLVARTDGPGRELRGPRGAAWDALRERLAVVQGTVGPVARRRPGGPDPGELIRLRYPLHTGTHWTIRPDPEFTAHVEGHDPIRVGDQTLIGHRIRIESELFSAADRVIVWYGRQGFLGLQAHLESVGTDPDGNPQRLVIEQRETLDDLAIEGPRF